MEDFRFSSILGGKAKGLPTLRWTVGKGLAACPVRLVGTVPEHEIPQLSRPRDRSGDSSDDNPSASSPGGVPGGLLTELGRALARD